MKKDAYYFGHDANARNDLKIKALRQKYGSEGYGNFWIVIECLREHENYKLPIKAFTWIALAQEFNKTPEEAEKFIDDCIENFELFETDNSFFWSKSLNNRMKVLDDKREQARQAGKISAKKRKEAKKANASSTVVYVPFKNKIKEK